MDDAEQRPLCSWITRLISDQYCRSGSKLSSKLILRRLLSFFGNLVFILCIIDCILCITYHRLHNYLSDRNFKFYIKFPNCESECIPFKVKVPVESNSHQFRTPIHLGKNLMTKSMFFIKKFAQNYLEISPDTSSSLWLSVFSEFH